MSTLNLNLISAGITDQEFRDPYKAPAFKYKEKVRGLRNVTRACMIDLETEDTEPTAVIAQISAIVFDPNPVKSHLSNAGSIITSHIDIVDSEGSIIAPHFDVFIDRSSGAQPGRTRSKDTHKWISELPTEVVRKVWLDGDRISLGEALLQLEQFMVDNEVQIIVAHPPVFDINMIRHAFKQIHGRDIYIPFFSELDCKSLEVLMYGRNTRLEGEINAFGDKHNGLHDCVAQCKVVQGVTRNLTALHSKACALDDLKKV